MPLAAHNMGPGDPGEKTRLLLADLWRRNRPVIEERLGILDRAWSLTSDARGIESCGA